MTATRKKIEKLKEKITELDEKMKEMVLLKKEYQKQVSELEDEELFMFVKSLNMSVDALADNLEMGKLVRDSGLSKSDIEDLISDPNNSDLSIKRNDDAPIKEEDTENVS